MCMRHASIYFVVRAFGEHAFVRRRFCTLVATVIDLIEQEIRINCGNRRRRRIFLSMVCGWIYVDWVKQEEGSWQ